MGHAGSGFCSASSLPLPVSRTPAHQVILCLHPPQTHHTTQVFNSQATPRRSTSGVVLALDSARELQIGLGRAWPFPQTLGPRETVLSATIVRQIGLDPDKYEGAHCSASPFDDDRVCVFVMHAVRWVKRWTSASIC
jgi:hypothetical protein